MRDNRESRIELPEEKIIFAKCHLDSIKAIADSLIALERNGYTDELCEGSIHALMMAIDNQVEAAKALLKY